MYYQEITGERHHFPQDEKGDHLVGDDNTDHGKQEYQCKKYIERDILFVFQIHTKIKGTIDGDTDSKNTQDQKEKCPKRREYENFWQWKYVSHQRCNSYCAYSYKKNHLQNVYHSEH